MRMPLYIFFWGGGIGAALIIGSVVVWKLKSKPVSTPPPLNPNIAEMVILTNGAEQFSPVLESGRVYEFTVYGTCRFERPGFFFGWNGVADAAYHTYYDGPFQKAYGGVRVNGKSIQSQDS